VQKTAQFDDRIRNLIALAEDGSQHSRTLLFSHISDLFLQQRPMASAVQVRMLADILKELLDQVTLSTRQEIASTLCALPSPPEQLINILCEDIVEVSGPLLEKAILPDDKIIHLIRYGTERHRIHISRRFGLSPLVRHELEKAYQESQGSKLKYSLNELDKLSEDHIPHIDEEATANILEVLRAQKIHSGYPETTINKMPAPEDIIQKSAFTNMPGPETQKNNSEALSRATDIESRPEPETKSERKTKPEYTDSPSQQPLTPETSDASGRIQDPGYNLRQNTLYQGQDGPFQKNMTANDTSPSDKNAVRDAQNYIQHHSIIHMNDATSDLADDIWQQVQGTREETNKQRDLVRAVADWFWEVDRTGLISFVSEESSGAFGCAGTTLIGENFISLCKLPDTLEAPNKNTNIKDSDINYTANHDDGEQETFEFLFERRSSFRHKPFYISSLEGKESLWLISAIAIFDIHTGRFTGFRGSARSTPPETFIAPLKEEKETPPVMPIAQDMPPEKAFEAYVAGQNLKAQGLPNEGKAALKAYDDEIATELLQNVSHEFRTPLNAIIGFSEMINMETWGPVNEQYHKNTKNILSAAGHLKEAVNDVLDSAKLDAGLMPFEPESFSLKSVLKNSQKNVKPLAEKHQVEFLDNSNNIDVILYNDKQSVELCLTKIFSSIIKRAAGGEILGPSVMINSNAQVRVEIPILGPKIDEKNAQKLFQKVQTEPDEEINFLENDINYAPKISPGFGLHVAKNLANMIGGDISAHTAEGYVTHLALTLSNHEPAS